MPLWCRVRLSLIPSEALQRIAVLHPPLCPPHEPPELRRYMQILQRIGSRFEILCGQIAPLLPEKYAREGARLTAEFESTLRHQLDRHAAAVKAADPTQRIDVTLPAWSAMPGSRVGVRRPRRRARPSRRFHGDAQILRRLNQGYRRGKGLLPAGRSSWGTLIGTTAGIIGKFSIGLLMILWFLVAAFVA